MLKKLLVLAVFLGLMVSSSLSQSWAQDGEHTKFIKAHGGLIGTGEQIENKELFGTFKIDGLIRVYKPYVYTVVGFQDVLNGEIDGESYSTGINLFTRNPNSLKPSLYVVAENGLTHIAGNNKLGEYTYGGGFGVLIPWALLDVTFMGEFSVTQIAEARLFKLTFGVLSGIDL